MRNIDFEKALKGDYCCENFSKFLQNTENPLPDLRIYDFMVLGPFVLETDGAFETEYFFERDKTLNCDYLEESGGERAQIPYLGKKVKNNYYGSEYLTWKKGFRKWDMLRFDAEEDSCNDALFATEQRNCVFYVSTYIDCTEETDAVICYENSGSNLYLNGELLHSQPYGRVNGVKSVGNTVPVHFIKGKNLIMFKIRTGYIADTIDLSMSNCSIYPLSMKVSNVGITQPMPTLVYFGDKEKPRQMFQSFTAAFEDSQNIEISYSSKYYEDKILIDALKQGSCKLLRIQSPSAEQEEVSEVRFDISVDGEKGKGSFLISTKPFCGFDGKEYAFSAFHFDTTYHQEQRTYALGAMHITKCIVDKLIEDPNFKAILSEVDYLHPYYSIYPKHREILKKAFEDARLEADCFYNQPNDLTSSPEGFTRNLIYGQLYHRDVMGRIVPVYAPGDVFGHPNQMSQICAKGGCIAARWGKSIMGVDSIMRHVSPDGTSLLHDKGIGKYDAMRLGLKHCENSSQARSTVPAFAVDDSTEWMKDTINKTEFGILSDMLKGMINAVEQNEKEDGYSKVSYTSHDITQHHSGVLLTRTDFKQANRLAENLLVTAEKFSAIACYYGAEYPEKALDNAWRQLLCAQHHDSITGTNNEISFVDLMIEYREAIELASEIVNNAILFLAAGVEAEGNEKLYYVFNAHPWKRTDVCEVTLPKKDENRSYVMIDSDGKEIPLQVAGKTIDGYEQRGVFAATIPAMGYATFVLKELAESHLDTDHSDCIENEFYKIKVDASLGGGIVSLYDKKAKKEVINLDKDGPGNRIVVLKEVPDRMETQHEFYTTGHKMFSSDYLADVKCEKNAVYQQYIVTVKMDTVAKIKQVITLYKGIKRVDMQTTVEDYQSRDDLFTLTFPVNVEGGKPIYDDRFAPHVCSKSNRKLSFQSHQLMGFSHFRVAPANQWFELGRTVVAKFSNEEKEIGDINIGMTAIIRKNKPAYIKLSEKLLHTLSKKAIPVTQYPDEIQDGGFLAHHFNEDLDNTDTRFVFCVQNEETDYAKKLFRSLSERERERFDEIYHNNSKAILCVKDNDNIYKKTIDVILIKAQTVELLAEIIDDIDTQLSKDYVLHFNNAFVNYSMGHTDSYGVALLNKGTIACSVEPDNLMNMMLFHTADFYGNIGKTTDRDQLIPEQKTHTFSYALYPHEKSYREANTYRRGFEFNDKLLSITDVVSTGIKKFLPREKSFAEVSENYAVTSFKLGGYPMAQMKSDFGTFSERGFSIRGFETNGVKGKVKLKLGFYIENVHNTDLLEENPKAIKFSKDSFSDDIKAYSIETYTFKAVESAQKVIDGAKLGATREIVEPTYVRSWEHDLGSMNMGYLSVAGVIGKDIEKIDDCTYRFNVSMVNNYCDKKIAGTINITATDGFEVDIKEIPYSIEPQGMMVQKITVKKPDADAKGIIRMHYTNDGQLFEDLFEFGYFNPAVTLEKVDDKLIATINNDTTENLYGEIAIATPYETWSASGFNAEAWGNIYPRTQKYEVESGKRIKVEFNIDEIKEDDICHAYWAVVKLMVNGRIHFAYVQMKGERHNVWAHEFINVLNKENSWKPLLEL